MKAVRRAAALVTTAIVATMVASCGVAAGQTTEGQYDSTKEIEPATLSVMGFADPDDVGQTRWDIAEKAIAPQN